MKFDETHMAIDGSLENIDEAKAYIKFLESEKLRHLEGAGEIHERIIKIKADWGIE